jgi:hypothetical protein
VTELIGAHHIINSNRSTERLNHLGDFTASARILPISGLAIFIGVVAAFVSPAGHHLGAFVVLVPVIGALLHDWMQADGDVLAPLRVTRNLVSSKLWQFLVQAAAATTCITRACDRGKNAGARG